MFYRPLIFVMVLGLSGSVVSAERPFGTVKPNTGTEIDYKFDVNGIPVGAETSVSPSDLNFPPNIVFTPDSQKGFVSYPGSDKILVFRPSTGEILATIPTSKNPALMAMTPDGKKLAVPCLFLKDNTTVSGDVIGKEIGAVNVIDVETYEVKTLDLTKVFFSFANNIVFSADSKTGFLASSKTGEILRFDVDTATEITPRLAMPAGSRPASLTMAPDFSYFTVVLTGWRIGVTLVPDDSVGIIDPQSFQVLRWMDSIFEDKDIKPDFQAVNTVALTKDGQLGLIAEQLTSTIAPSPLTQDRAILFEPGTGKVVKIFNTGDLPGSAHTTPDGFRFVVIGEIWVMIIDTRNDEIGTVSPIYADFKPGNRPAFSPDGKRMFVTTPLSDHLLVFSLDTGEVMRVIDVGNLINPPATDDPLAQVTCPQTVDGRCTAAPLDLAVTPDGKVLASANFNANTIDLIGDSLDFAIPSLFAYPPPADGTTPTANWFTGVAFTNNSSSTEAIINTNAYSWAGVSYQDELSTTDVTEYTNPNTITLAPGAQKAFTAADLLKPASGNTVEGWLDVDSNVFQTGSFFMVGDADLKRLDGAPAFMQTASTVVIPEVRVLNDFRTELSVFNYSWTAATVTLKLYNDQGALLETSDPLALQGGMESTGYVKDPDGTEGGLVGLFPDTAFENFAGGYIVAEADHPIIAIERYYDAERMSVLYGFPKGAGFNVSTTFFVPQAAAFAGSETFLDLVNTGQDTATITAVLKDSSGNAVGSPATFQLEAGKQSRNSVADLFQLTDGGTTVSGWIQVDTDQPGLIGDAEIRTFDGRAMTTLPLTPSGGKHLSFSHVAQGLGYSTGISLLNPGQLAATAEVEIFSPDGVRVAGKQVTIPPGGRLVNMLTDAELFPNLEETIGGYVRVTSDQDLIGVEIFFTDNLELLSLVPGQVIQE